MTKQTGLGDNFYLDGYDLSGDIGALQTISNSRALLDVTGIDKDAHERLPGLGDAEMSFNNWFNPEAVTAPLGAHEVLKDISLEERQALYFRGTTLGGPVGAMRGAQASYQLNRGNDGSLAGTVQIMNSGGRFIEWGRSLTAGHITVVAAGNLTGLLDLTFPQGSTDHLSVFWQLFALEGSAGDDINVKLQESDYFTAIGADDDAVLLVVNLTNATFPADGAGFTGTVEPRRVTITIVDTTPSINAGTVQIVGTDSRGDALSETVSIAGGAGVYTTTKFFTTVTSAVVSGAATLDGAGDETIKIGVEAAVVSYTDVTGGAFTAVDIADAPQAQHINVTGAVKRAIRAVITTVDGFDSAELALAVKRYN